MSDGQYGPSYSLYGVICHAGSGPNSGHYYAYVKAANGRWYEMNDESVSPCTAPLNKKSAYMLFYIRNKGQALEAAVNRPPVSMRSNVAAGMKKRKGSDAADENMEDTGVKTARPFIGPQLPTSIASATPSQPQVKANDPQADLLRKKIAAAPKAKVTHALQSLSQYSDDSDSDADKPSCTTLTTKADPTQRTSSPPQEPPPSSPAPPFTIPPTNFYDTPSHRTKLDKGTKRKSPDGEADENMNDRTSQKEWARKHITTPPRVNGSQHLQPRGQIRRFSGGIGNPYDRITSRGSGGLVQGSSNGYKSPVTYKNKRRRGFGI